jgi:spermidine synthase
MSVKRFERLLLLLFVVSGFAGLIYQSIWSHYLGLLLGHAAYAQTLVLAMFMGGMAIGAWLVSRRSGGWRNLILAYAAIEALIGLCGLLFHSGFLAYQQASYGSVLPALGSPGLIDAYLWLTSALMIAPQTIMLGATFPLMSAAYLRLAPRDDSRILGGLYFSNSIGATFGALAATFLLMPAVGMPGTMLTAGLLNLFVAFVAWAASKRMPLHESSITPEPQEAPRQQQGNVRQVSAALLLLAAGITGATSFVYEIGWVRLLNQALGSSRHTFELMLSAFIFGLALGGYWIRQRSARVNEDVLRYAGHAQVLMGLAALLSLPVFAHSFEWVGWLRGALEHNDSGYFLMTLGGSVIAIAVMVPAAFFAGMTLPLFTTAVLRGGSGESGIGRIYAANTLGAIVGVFAVVHLLIPLIGVHGAIVFAAILDILLGLVLLARGSVSSRMSELATVSLVSAAFCAIAFHFGALDPRAQAAGAFRTGNSRYSDAVKIDFIRDGKTSTVSVVTDSDRARIIATNGKSDAGLTMDETRPFADEVTMVMAGSLPILLHPDPKHIAFIGWGSGLSTHTALGSSRPESIETIEIERAMYEGAKHFGVRVERAYNDPRSHVYFNDARTHFSRSAKRYDVIVSEPSNPWVAGVASLFTHEFYTSMRPHLKPNGIFVQWLHTYEINDRLFATMMAALLKVFPSVDTYMSSAGDLIFVASNGAAPTISWGGVDTPQLKAEMARVGLGTPKDMQLRKVGNTETLRAFVRMMQVTPHSDFFPVVSQNAPRSMFKGERSLTLRQLAEDGMPILDAVTGREPPGAFPELIHHLDSVLANNTVRADAIVRSLRAGHPIAALHAVDRDSAADLAFIQQRVSTSLEQDEAQLWMESLSRIAGKSLGFLPAPQFSGAFDDQLLAPDAAASPAACAALLGSYRALAVRDYSAAAVAARALLERTAQLPELSRQHLLLMLMLDAANRRSYAEVTQIEIELGAVAPASAEQAVIRNFLLSWASLARNPS